MRYADIVPIARLPRGLGHFTYTIPDALAPLLQSGQVVVVPFRGRQITGLYTGPAEQPTGTFNVQAITRLALPTPLCTPQQLALFDTIASYYCVSPATVAQAFLPPLPRRQLPTSSTPQTVLWHPTVTPQLVQPAELSRQGTTVLWHRTEAWRTATLAAYLTTTPDQILIIVPQVSDIPRVGSFLTSAERAQAVTIGGSGRTIHHTFATWQRIQSGAARIIIGTRLAVAAPFTRLGAVIILDEDDDALKQWDQNPRYDARRVAAWLGEQHQAPVIRCTTAPTYATYAAIQSGQWQCVREPGKPPRLTLIDARAETRSSPPSVLTHQLQTAVTTCFDSQKTAFFFLNRRGLGSGVACADCRYQFVCQTCHGFLSPQADDTLHCRVCATATPLPATCPRCRGTQFRFWGRGTQLTTRQLTALWPGKELMTIDTDSAPRTLTPETLASADGLVGTEAAIKHLNRSRLGVVAVLSIDNLLGIPLLRSSERLAIILQKLQALAADAGLPEWFLQTAAPDTPLFTAVATGTLDQWYQDELALRRDFGYPPYGHLTALITRGGDDVHATATALYQTLTEVIHRDKIEAVIQPAVRRPTGTKKNRWRYSITIQHAGDFPPSLRQHIPTDWVIDVDTLDAE